MRKLVVTLLLTPLLLLTSASRAEVIHVGPQHQFARIEDAIAHAAAGDTILVHPLADNRPYEHTALFISLANLTIRAATLPSRIALSGEGFEYSGVGVVPRAIIQLNPGADNCLVEGFEFSHARNSSHNGAGIRINQANHVTIRGCTIHDNEMGIMSNGGPGTESAIDQRIENCLIFHNGSAAETGQSHNLYLGGTSAVLTGCEIHSSTAGHNVKSRAHYTRIEYCYVHDSANREFDLVDAAGDTDTPESDAVILGCIISKQTPEMTGNRGVIHFGQDGGKEHTGTLYIVNSTIITPYQSPVTTLSSAGARLSIANCLFTGGNGNQHNQSLVAAAGKFDSSALKSRTSSQTSIRTPGFTDALLGVMLTEHVQFSNPATVDFHVASLLEPQVKGAPLNAIQVPSAPGRPKDSPGIPLGQYSHPQSVALRGDDDAPCIGAFEALPQAKPASNPR